MRDRSPRNRPTTPRGNRKAKEVKAFVVGLLILLLLLLMVVVMLWTINDYYASESQIPGCLPKDATEIQSEGNDWWTFKWKGKKFLYHHEWGGNREAITELSE